MGDKAIAQALVRQQGFAVFEFLGAGTFCLVGKPADFWHDLPGVVHTTGPRSNSATGFLSLTHF